MDAKIRAQRGRGRGLLSGGGLLSGRGRSAGLMAALVFLVALNLRPSVTAVGPLLPQIASDTGMDEGIQGLLGALPVLAFALVSPLVHRASHRLGPEPVVLGSLVVLAAGTLVRSWAGDAGLWVGTVLVGVAIAVGNVLVPALVKRDYADTIAWATSLYSTCLTVGSAVAAAAAVPLANAWGWRSSLAVWALPAGLVALVWVPRTLHTRPIPAAGRTWSDAKEEARASVWRSRTAWQVTLFMGLQSTAFYTLVTWLPTVQIAAGFSAETAGFHLFVFQLVGIPAGLLLPLLMRDPHSQVLAAVVASVPMVVGVLGLVLAPGAGLWWAVLTGLGAGPSLVMAMTLIGLRSRGPRETTRLSGMVQSVGYLLAAVGPVVFGQLAKVADGWQLPLSVLAVVAAAQVVVAVFVGRVAQAPGGTSRLLLESGEAGSSLEEEPEDDA